MKVLYISGSLPPMKCGVGDYVYNLITNAKILESSIQIGIVTSTEAKKIEENQTESVENFHEISNWNFLEIPKIWKIVKFWQPDIIHIQYPTTGYRYQLMPNFLPLLLMFSGAKIIQTWHDPFSKKGIFRYLPNLLTQDMVIVVEENFKDYLPKWYQSFLFLKKIEHIPVASNIPFVALHAERYQDIRKRYGSQEKKLIAFFGFANPKKGIEQIFEIADPREHHIVLICELMSHDPYHQKVLSRLNSSEWYGKVFITGFLPEHHVGEVLAASDAAIYPFTHGATSRNASILAAQTQGTFVLTTSKEQNGYNEPQNIYYAEPNNIEAMRIALNQYVGTKRMGQSSTQWTEIAQQHIRIYQTQLL
jgi:glycosyltransferase involved in cell wall biosynthesis